VPAAQRTHNGAREVGNRDPVTAAHDAMRGRAIDEVILSTLPASRSRWLRQDVPSRLRSSLDLPLAVVTPDAD
jgi:hypothetical protein